MTDDEYAQLVEDIKKSLPKKQRRVWTGDVRGILSVLALVGTFLLGGVQLGLTGSAEVPAWTVSITGAVMGFYFGGRSEEARGSSTTGPGHEHTYMRGGVDEATQTRPESGPR